MSSKHDIKRNACQLFGRQAKCGYDWWWHSFTAQNAATGEDQPFYIEFFLCNPKQGGDKPIFGDVEKGIKPSYLMVNVGAWGKKKCQLHRFFGWKNIKVNMGVPFSVEADDCYITETETRGSIYVSEKDAAAHPEWMSDGGEISWDLKINKITAFNVGYGASSLFRRLQAFEMFWHAEGMKSAFEGEIIFGGERYIVTPEKSFGYADKNWGRNFTTPWVWLSSNNLTSEISGKKLENSVFDIGGGRPVVLGIALPRQLLSLFYYEGKDYEFNFSKFWTFPKTKFHCYETDSQIVWHVEQSSAAGKMITDITCKKEDMLLIRYEAPTGEKRHTRLWNGGNGVGTICLYKKGKLIDRIHAENVGCEYGEFDATEPYRE